MQVLPTPSRWLTLSGALTNGAMVAATETRTPLSYVLRPFMFYFDRAFRDWRVHRKIGCRGVNCGQTAVSRGDFRKIARAIGC